MIDFLLIISVISKPVKEILSFFITGRPHKQQRCEQLMRNVRFDQIDKKFNLMNKTSHDEVMFWKARF